ncbi:hypothetical protein ESCO_000866 [Escovopsis weberi]|uniref:Uncharacterized protein n=1 Tax=Escovopsis weberi TaxID=150374 RepID=A0A0M9VTM2_ESCWE|nr:hypothetical protein ESCO_000866 [Escovopsis weberi]
MESLQLSQMLADLSNLGAAEPDAAAAIAQAANVPAIQTSLPHNTQDAPPTSAGQRQNQNQNQQQPTLRRAWSSETNIQPRYDVIGRRFMINSPKSGSAANSTPGTPRHLDLEEDLERANTLMALYDIRAKLKQQDHSSLIKAREKINALAARQQAQQAAERNMKAAEEMRRNRYSFPKS